MKKTWLIRTKNNHILGPVSKDKIKELLKSGSIKGDDEICCANGFWMYVRERELLDQYVFGDEIQKFNPVQEAMPCQISNFPLDLNLLKVQPESTGSNHQVASTSVQPNPFFASPIENIDALDNNEVNKMEKKKSDKRVIKTRNLKNIKSKSQPAKTLFNKRSLNLLILLFLLIMIISFLKRELIIDSFKKLSSISIFQNANAQSIMNSEKKKIFIILK